MNFTVKGGLADVSSNGYKDASDEMKSRMAKAFGERNEIECSFGTGKRIYRANDIRAKLPDTARCRTGMCYFGKNVMKFLRELCLALTELWRFFINFAL